MCWCSARGRPGCRSRVPRCCRTIPGSGCATTPVLDSRNWQIAYTNMFIYGICFVVLTMAIGLLLAVLIDQRIRGGEHLPHAVSLSAGGVLRGHRHGLGLAAQSAASAFRNWCRTWAGPASASTGVIDRDMAIYTMVIAGVWQRIGFRHGAVPGGAAICRCRPAEGGADRRRRTMAHLSPRGVSHHRADLHRRRW